MELVLQLALVQKPATFQLFDCSYSSRLYLSGKALVRAVNAARATGHAVLTFMVTEVEGCNPEQVKEAMDRVSEELKEFLGLNILHENELYFEMRTNIKDGQPILDAIFGRIDLTCTDHPSQLSASKAKQKTLA